MFLQYTFYDVRYAILNSSDIINLVQPPNEKYIEIKNKCYNNFYINLEESILEHGVKNPILVTAGIKGSPLTVRNKHKIPNNIELNDIIVCDRLGGSRLWVAQKHNLKIPCIISDFINKFFDKEKLETFEQIYGKFTNRPAKIDADKCGLHVYGLPNVSN